MRMRNYWSKSICLISLCFILQLSEIHLFSKVRDNSTSDAAIVLGAAVWNRNPSPVFAERINHAIYLYEEGIVEKIIFTGGFFNDSTLSESQVAKTYAEKMGVKSNDIFIEEKSKNTKENLLFAREILKKEKFSKVLLVSDPIHMKRVSIIAKYFRIEGKPSPTTTSRFTSRNEKLKFLLSETLFTIGFRLRHLV